MAVTRAEIIDSCKLALGDPVVSLYMTDEQIDRLISVAIRKCTSKACPLFWANKYSGNGVVDISDLDAETVKMVYQGYSGSGSPGDGSGCGGNCSSCGQLEAGCSICQYAAMRGGPNDLTNSNIRLWDTMAYQLATAELRRYTIPDFHYESQEGLLYLDNYHGEITVEYTKRTIHLDDLDTEWASWVESYAIALAKITEGRIRNKYKLSSGVFEIEADELVSEGNSDKQELEQKLTDYIGYWNIMR